jgi:putative ABC transport system ATP-binding protein
MKALELQSITKTFGSGTNLFTALQDADLVVEQGELVAVMGPSGSGKSTLLTISGGLETPTSGAVIVGGIDLSAMSRDQRSTFRRKSIGYVFQDLNLLSSLTAAENVALPLELDGISTKRARSIAIAALERVDVHHKADDFPDDLSGGERQRVAIARALVESPNSSTPPRLLLADEPTGALDSVNGEAIMSILATACNRGAAGVIVTHDAQHATWADRIVFLRDGRIVDSTVRSDPADPSEFLATAGR